MPVKQFKKLAHISTFASEPIVFFTIVTNERKSILANDEAHKILTHLWAQSHELNGWCVGDYVIMPDHVHLFARMSRTAIPMRKWIQMWKSLSSRLIKAIQKLDEPVWQRDYFDRYLRSEENYADKWKYIEANPVRAGLVKDVGDWPYKGRIHRLTY